MTPATIRKQQERQRRKDAGLVRIEAWVKPDDVQAVKLAIALIVDGADVGSLERVTG